MYSGVVSKTLQSCLQCLGLPCHLIHVAGLVDSVCTHLAELGVGVDGGCHSGSRHQTGHFRSQTRRRLALLPLLELMRRQPWQQQVQQLLHCAALVSQRPRLTTASGPSKHRRPQEPWTAQKHEPLRRNKHKSPNGARCRAQKRFLDMHSSWWHICFFTPIGQLPTHS